MFITASTSLSGNLSALFGTYCGGTVVSQSEVSATEERVQVKGGPKLATRYAAEYNESWLVLRGWPPLEHS